MMQFTIDSDDEIEPEVVSDEEEEEYNGSAGFNFAFDDGETIQRKRSTKKKTNDITYDTLEDEDNVKLMPHTEERAERAKTKIKKSDAAAEVVGMDAETEAAYFDSVIEGENPQPGEVLFSQLNLSRSLLRAVEASGYINPTPVQAKVIPVAMTGRDICASAVTGSGKTAAFVLPILERLIYRPKDVATIRVLIITPTRELASQIYSVLLKLTQFTDITSCLICGGKKDVRHQETVLRNRPDIVICTPGRFIDHLRNSPSISIDSLDILVLDEVDRLLELGFQDEVKEILQCCPKNRQTLLFTATMTAGVDDLAKLSLNKPIRIKTEGTATSVAPRLQQEFVRLRNTEDTEAILLSLLCRHFQQRVIVFFETKKDAHRFALLASCFDIKYSELHGDLQQVQRDAALTQFKSGVTNVLIATDVAARGLDIQGVQTVINAEMPRTVSTYIHRVGRTARAGKTGRSITLVSDGRRKVMKDLLKGEGNMLTPDPSSGILSRSIPAAVISHYISRIAAAESTVAQLMKDEKTNRFMANVEAEAERAENMVLHEDDIKSRPKRTWYQSEAMKKEVKEQSRQQVKEVEEKLKNKGSAAQYMVMNDEYRDDAEKGKKSDHRLSRKKRRKLEAMKASEDDGKIYMSIYFDDLAETPEPGIRIQPKKAKLIERETATKKQETTIDEISNKRKQKGEKVKRPIFAVGGFDQDLNDWNGSSSNKLSKKASKQDAALKDFKEFDYTKKLRKGGKLGKHSFKSKGKFKRRK